MMLNMKYPCQGCVEPKRHSGCHDRCSEYLAVKTKSDSIKAERSKEMKSRALGIDAVKSHDKYVYKRKMYRQYG